MEDAPAAAPRLPAHLDWLLRPAPLPSQYSAHERTPAASDDDVTGAYSWPAGSRLAGELRELADCRGAEVADLGCGLGQLGFSAIALGAHRVLFADGSPPLIDLAERTIACNQLGARAQASIHRWGQALPGGGYALILGGDILYRPECFAAIADTLMASLARGGVCLLADPRTRLDAEFAAELARRALCWSCERRSAGYTLARVRWLDG
jgi:predicted nicotinamide N-methyase